MTIIKSTVETLTVPYSEIQPGQFFRRGTWHGSTVYKMVEVYFGDRAKRVSISINDQCGGTYILEDNELVIPVNTLEVKSA